VTKWVCYVRGSFSKNAAKRFSQAVYVGIQSRAIVLNRFVFAQFGAKRLSDNRFTLLRIRYGLIEYWLY
jgi:hypothetical protein